MCRFNTLGELVVFRRLGGISLCVIMYIFVAEGTLIIAYLRTLHHKIKYNDHIFAIVHNIYCLCQQNLYSEIKMGHSNAAMVPVV